jgi:hypothetical protein
MMSSHQFLTAKGAISLTQDRPKEYDEVPEIAKLLATCLTLKQDLQASATNVDIVPSQPRQAIGHFQTE